MYLKIAHRGASGYERENTLAAFEKAIELGADMVELDVHLSKDGIAVVHHDPVAAGFPIAEVPFASIRMRDPEIPTLREVIEGVSGRCGLYIELKGAGTGRVVSELVQHYQLVSDVIVASFDPVKVRWVKEYAPTLMTSVLCPDPEGDFVALAREAKADCIHFCWESHPAPHLLLTDEVMARAMQHQLNVIIWHEERPEVIREIVKKPIYGICSNLPDLL